MSAPLVANGVLDSGCADIFRTNGEPLSLYMHQEQAIALAAEGESFVVTTGTGSGKSLCFFVPIVNHVLDARRTDAKRRTHAIVVYPMNALANSQMDELTKFIDQVPGDRPVTFDRYTGQDDRNERRRIAREPPDILLTNFMMLELLMTRQEEFDRLVIGNCEDLRFLVLDELHTYRGRQGADVALLVRRVRERLQPRDLLCIGTSATMASEGSLEDKNRVVADVASKLFGCRIAESNVVTETLERITDSAATAESVSGSLGDAIDAGIPPHISDAALREHSLAVWVETRLGISFSDIDQRWVRARPRTVTEAVADLSEESGRPSIACRRVLRDLLLVSSVPERERTRGPRRERAQLLRLQAPPVHLGRRSRVCDAGAARRAQGDNRRPAVPSRPRGEAPLPGALLSRMWPRVPPGSAGPAGGGVGLPRARYRRRAADRAGRGRRRGERGTARGYVRLPDAASVQQSRVHFRRP